CGGSKSLAGVHAPAGGAHYQHGIVASSRAFLDNNSTGGLLITLRFRALDYSAGQSSGTWPPDPGKRWPSRLVATAAEDHLSFHNATFAGRRDACTHKSTFCERGSVNVRFAPKATKVLHSCELTRAINGLVHTSEVYWLAIR